VSGAPPWPPIDAANAIPWVEHRTGLQLAESQREAVRLALASKALVITGGPGVGKTTLVNSILKIVIAKQVRVALCAPTGRAAKRLSERAPASRRRRFTACWRRTRAPASFAGPRSTPWTATCRCGPEVERLLRDPFNCRQRAP
jgi:AAA domain